MINLCLLGAAVSPPEISFAPDQAKLVAASVTSNKGQCVRPLLCQRIKRPTLLLSTGNGSLDKEDSTMPICIALELRWKRWKVTLYITFPLA